MNPALVPGLFEPAKPICVARAPGRLDVMGGIADYSGSLVLQLPIAEAAYVSVQRSDGGEVSIARLDDCSAGTARTFALEKHEWADLQRADYESAKQILVREPSAAWAAYVLGPVLVLLRETGAKLQGGLRILVDSSVPEGKGVSSSAAVEVATMRAVAALMETHPSGEQLARWCQLAENLVVGALCGIMDQMTSALGRENKLLALRCQPATVEGYVPIPNDIAFWGIDSGIRHAVSGSDYTAVRCGAFMGYRIIAEAAGLNVKPDGDPPGTVAIDDPLWKGYLANITPAEFHARFAAAVPEQMTGKEFLDRYGGTADRVTHVDPARTYAVRQPTLHPIEENARVEQFRDLLTGELNESLLREMGQLMAASHASYTACGLASDGTDLLVELIRETGAMGGLYGAKISGGGSGGTVVVLGRADADNTVEQAARRYSALTGRSTHVFRGSSAGAFATEVIRVAS